MNVRRAANGARTRNDARSHSLALLTVGALLLPILFLSLGATDADAAPMPMAQAEVLYGVVPDGGDSMLVTVDPGSESIIENVGRIIDSFGFGFAGVTGLAFANHDTLFAVSGDKVLKIDLSVVNAPGVVVATELAVLADPVYDLDFDAFGFLFGIQNDPDNLDGATTTLVIIDPISGVPVRVPLPPPALGTIIGRGGAGNGLAFGGNGTLYNASGEVTEGIFGPVGLPIDWLELDVLTGTGTDTPQDVRDSSGTAIVGRISSMALSQDKVLFGSLNVTSLIGDPLPDFLVRIDASGVVTKVGDPTPTPTTEGLDGLAFRPPAAGGCDEVRFASFEVTKLDLKKKNSDFHIHAKFSLGARTNDVDIVGEPFTFQVINDDDEVLFELNLPDGGVSFSEKRTNKFQYKVHNKSTKEKVDIKIDIKKNGEYKFHAKGKHVVMNLGDPENKAMVRVKLTIGDDFGDVSGVRAKIKK